MFAVIFRAEIAPLDDQYLATANVLRNRRDAMQYERTTWR
jgi:hypothetical protein